MDVDEPGVGEQVQQEPDAGGMRGRLEDQRAGVPHRELLQERRQGTPPSSDLSLLDVSKRQVAVVVGPVTGEAPSHVGRQACHRAEGELVLARHAGTQGHLVLVSPPDDEAVDDRGGPPLGVEEGVGVEHLEEGR